MEAAACPRDRRVGNAPLGCHSRLAACGPLYGAGQCLCAVGPCGYLSMPAVPADGCPALLMLPASTEPCAALMHTVACERSSPVSRAHSDVRLGPDVRRFRHRRMLCSVVCVSCVRLGWRWMPCLQGGRPLGSRRAVPTVVQCEFPCQRVWHLCGWQPWRLWR